jgi:hypothetical protein
VPTYSQTLLAEFTDRDDEMAAFARLLDDKARKLLCIWGEGNLGKTSLLARMADHAVQRGIKTVSFTWQEVSYGYIDVMRRIRDGLDPARQSCFQPFNDLVNFFTKPGYELVIRIDGTFNTDILERSRVEGSSIGDIAGIIIKDLNLPQPREDRETSKEERMVRLTDSFISCLARATVACPALILLDTLEKATEDTSSWLRGQILPAL